jgi:glycine/D-amino acid oxidase-like deaminating enzyme
MMKNTYDFLVVGHGLAGSVVSQLLIQTGQKVAVVDSFNPRSSSQVAAGLVNPVTGRRVVKSWMADTLIPFAAEYYKEKELESGVSFYHPMDLLEVINNTKDLNEWTTRSADGTLNKYFIKEAPEELYRGKLKNFNKLIRINSSAWMNIPFFTNLCRQKIKNSGLLLETEFEFDKLKFHNDTIEYNSMKFGKVILCNGYYPMKDIQWTSNPFLPAKGEILTIFSDVLPEEFILMGGIFVIPIGNKLFRAGATYEWNFENDEPSESGKTKITDRLNDLLNVPYKVVDHRSGIRPTIKDRRPILGEHPNYKNVYFFNGMGTKGVQLVPYFANHLINVLNKKENLMKEVNVNRFF